MFAGLLKSVLARLVLPLVRLLAHTFARLERQAEAASRPASAGAGTDGLPAHWLELVRRHAPQLLDPRRRGGDGVIVFDARRASARGDDLGPLDPVAPFAAPAERPDDLGDAAGERQRPPAMAWAPPARSHPPQGRAGGPAVRYRRSAAEAGPAVAGVPPRPEAKPEVAPSRPVRADGARDARSSPVPAARKAASVLPPGGPAEAHAEPARAVQSTPTPLAVCRPADTGTQSEGTSRVSTPAPAGAPACCEAPPAPSATPRPQPSAPPAGRSRPLKEESRWPGDPGPRPERPAPCAAPVGAKIREGRHRGGLDGGSPTAGPGEPVRVMSGHERLGGDRWPALPPDAWDSHDADAAGGGWPLWRGEPRGPCDGADWRRRLDAEQRGWPWKRSLS